MSVEDIFGGVTAGAADDVVQIQRVVVLSAITEAIREKGVDPSPTAYYGALMASLTAQRTGGESDTTVAGATYLLALLLPHLPHSLLGAFIDGRIPQSTRRPRSTTAAARRASSRRCAAMAATTRSTPTCTTLRSPRRRE